MPAIVTNGLRIKSADFFQNSVNQVPAYVFIGGTSPWADETMPPSINDSTSDRIFAFTEFLGMKRIQTSDIISVLPRRDWIEGQVFDEYTDIDNIIDDKNPDTNEFYRFYVITDEFNVYKCISNNNRAQSTVKPSGTSINNFQTPDGYIWKYMYTVRSADAFRFMTPNWIPCYTLYSDDGSSQWLVQQSAVNGTIDNVIVEDGGTGYDPNNPPTVEITGDGTGASAIAEIDVDGAVSRILITEAGEGYTSAEITITDPTGVGAVARPVLAPQGGHGKDARLELGATFKMVRVVFEGDESGILPTGTEYRKAGVLINPESNDAGTVLVIDDVSMYRVGETVTGDSSLATGTVRSSDPIKGYLYLDNVTGVFSQDELISSQSYNETTVNHVFETDTLPMTVSVASVESFDMYSGELMYFSTREKITRGPNQQEETRFIIAF